MEPVPKGASLDSAQCSELASLVLQTQANTYKLSRKEDRELVRLEYKASRIQEICVHPSGLRHAEVAIFKPTEIFHSLVCPSPRGDTSKHVIDICHNSVMKGSWVQVQMKTHRGGKNPNQRVLHLPESILLCSGKKQLCHIAEDGKQAQGFGLLLLSPNCRLSSLSDNLQNSDTH